MRWLNTWTGFVSCKSGRFQLFLVEKMRRFSTDEKQFLFTLSVLWKPKKYAHVATSTYDRSDRTFYSQTKINSKTSKVIASRCYA